MEAMRTAYAKKKRLGLTSPKQGMQKCVIRFSILLVRISGFLYANFSSTSVRFTHLLKSKRDRWPVLGSCCSLQTYSTCWLCYGFHKNVVSYAKLHTFIRRGQLMGVNNTSMRILLCLGHGGWGDWGGRMEREGRGRNRSEGRGGEGRGWSRLREKTTHLI